MGGYFAKDRWIDSSIWIIFDAWKSVLGNVHEMMTDSLENVLRNSTIRLTASSLFRMSPSE